MAKGRCSATIEGQAGNVVALPVCGYDALMQDGLRLYRSFMNIRGRQNRLRIVRLCEAIERQERARNDASAPPPQRKRSG